MCVCVFVCSEGEEVREVHRLVVVNLPAGKGENGLVKQGKGLLGLVVCEL